MTISRSDVLTTFERLTARVGAGAAPDGGYVVEALPEKPRLFLGCASDGSPALLVASTSSSIVPPPIRLAALNADFGVRSLIAEGSDQREIRVSSLKCLSVEGTLADLFATVCAALIDSLSDSPSERELADMIGSWAGLFWRLGQKVATDVVGLAGELVLLTSATDLSRWVSAWHGDPNEVLDFDFVDSSISVEVKANRAANREHAVSLGQVLDPGLKDRLFASVHVELNDSGERLSSIVRDLSDRLDTKGRQDLWSVITKSCGEALEETLDRRVNLEKALSSIRFYRATDIPIPIIGYPLPAGVSSIKFTSRFDLAQEFTAQQVSAAVAAGHLD